MNDRSTDDSDIKTSGVNSIKPPPSNDALASDAESTAGEVPSSHPKESPVKITAPEPPRWRFVTEAKKSLGYNSLHAGSYIKGQSSNDLGAKYTAPDISLYKPAKEEVDVGKANVQLPASMPFAKDDTGVGKLGVNVPPHNAFGKGNNQVGKLNVQEENPTDSQLPTGSFGGLPKHWSSTSHPRVRFKEWDVNMEVGPKTERDHEWYDGQVHESYKMPGDEVTGMKVGGVGKLSFRGPGASEDAFVGGVPKGSRGQDLETAEGDELDDYGDPREGALFATNNGSESTNAKNTDNNEYNESLADPVKEASEKRKRRCLLILLPLLLVLVTILAVLFLKEEEEESAAVVAAATSGVVLIPPIIIMNETSVPSEMPIMMNPSKQPTVKSSEAPSREPTSSPVLSPTPPQPTRNPTNRPTPQPTCSTEQDFNLCIAVDMSGSVCNYGTNGSDCLNCRAAFLPIFFTSECRDNFVSEDTCCNNFANVKDFSSSMVNLLDDFPAEKSFSVVQFANSAQLMSGLKSVEQINPVISELDYTGGVTNHAAAIQMCQQTLSSFGGRKNFIMLVTDGVSTEPEFEPEAAAEEAATSAKSNGTFIIPVFISPTNDWDALAFMSRLSSDGEVFDVTDFDSLNSLQDRLVDQVSCA